MYVCRSTQLWVPSMGEPDVVESCGLRQFVGNCFLQKSYISDFEKLKVNSH